VDAMGCDGDRFLTDQSSSRRFLPELEGAGGAVEGTRTSPPEVLSNPNCYLVRLELVDFSPPPSDKAHNDFGTARHSK
jgi:hypothetical protein